MIHPAIDIEKTGPATATVGAALAYTLTVTNPGDVSFAIQDVIVTDPKCEAPPAGPSTGTDATPGQLDPGDVWTYTCTAQTAGQPAGTFVNTANVSREGLPRQDGHRHRRLPDRAEAQAVLPETSRLGAVARPERLRQRPVQRRPSAVRGSRA